MPVFSTAPLSNNKMSNKRMPGTRMSGTPSGTLVPGRRFSVAVFLATFLLAGTAAPARVHPQNAARQLPLVQPGTPRNQQAHDPIPIRPQRSPTRS